MNSLLPKVINEPGLSAKLTSKEWDILIPQARISSLLPSHYFLLEENNLLNIIPLRPRAHLFSDWIIYNNQVKAYNQMLEDSKHQQQKLREQQEAVDEQLKLQGENIERFSQLISRWEKQADRYDKILDKLEENS